MNDKIKELKDRSFNLEWNSSNSNEKSILFYISRSQDNEAHKKFMERMKGVKYHKLITNMKVLMGNVITLSENELFESMKDLCDFFYPYNEKLKTCAITGTNGKTTTVDFIRQLLINKNKKVLTIGTMGVYLNDQVIDDFKLTSPHFIDFRKIINKYQDEVEFLAVESSSHSIHQGRQYKFKFDQIGWTSFSQDHLDYHKNIKEYFEVKKRLQLQSKNKFIVSKNASAFKEKLDCEESHYDHTSQKRFLNVDYNKVNLDVALGILSKFDLVFDENEIESLEPTPGRFNVIEGDNQFVIIDFAHSPDGLANILQGIKKSFDKEVVCVFGCGGNRDKTKRPLMGEIAEKYADHLVITSDNPRDEDPEVIIEEIKAGLENKDVKTIVDRKTAIKFAIEKYIKSIVLIAGKGHENYIEVKGQRIDYSDIEVVKEVLEC